MDIAALNEISQGNFDNLPTTTMLVEGKEYKIKKFKLQDTKYGTRLAIFFEEGGYYFLPQRFSENVKNRKQVKELVEIDHHYFVFEGKDKTRGGFLKLKFVQKDE
ncbi:unnamed protein product [Hermetia illucens]|uniref:Uncharacterized protein n=1 Tax=Hermetia illucens TaxID=343691 RepID=A0A7R8YPP7_HERIL|nr:unnamed protein product [Hermetia illucens]